MAVLLCSPEFLGQLGAVDVGVQLSYWAQHDHLKQLRMYYFRIIILCSILWALYEDLLSSVNWIGFTSDWHAVRTGTFILNSSLLNLKRMSESVRCRRVVGLRTRTSWRFPGKEPWKETVDVDCHLCNRADRTLLHPESIIHHTCSVPSAGSLHLLYISPSLCLSLCIPRGSTFRHVSGVYRVEENGKCGGCRPPSCGRDINLHVLWDAPGWIMR